MKFSRLSKTIFIWLITVSAYAQIQPVNKDNVAIGGYDVVAYFLPGKATKGNPQINATFKGVIYYFSSQANKDAFVLNPEKYLPEFDGWCALAIAQEKKKVNINPETFKVTNGKLYLFYNAAHKLSGHRFNSLEPWQKNEPALINKANENWPAVKTTK